MYIYIYIERERVYYILCNYISLYLSLSLHVTPYLSIYLSMYIYICVSYIYIYKSLSIHIYVCMYVYIYIYTYIYIYIYILAGYPRRDAHHAVGGLAGEQRGAGLRDGLRRWNRNPRPRPKKFSTGVSKVILVIVHLSKLVVSLCLRCYFYVVCSFC